MNPDEYEQRQSAIKAALTKLSKKTDSKAAKAAAMEQTEEKKMVCSLVYELVEESLEMFANGDMTLAEMTKDLTSALKGLDGMDLSKLSDKKD